MKRIAMLTAIGCLGVLAAGAAVGQTFSQPGAKLRVLIVDGHNPYHHWEATTPLLKHHLESCGRFTVDVATTPADGEDMSGFRPTFSDYDVVLSNYNGQRWPSETEKEFARYVEFGGGFVSVHAANNAFPKWPEYNRICGLGGWKDRDESAGPYVYFDEDGNLIRDSRPGPAGRHGPQHEYTVTIRDAQHPITRDLPKQWMHAKDELYDSLRGPAVDTQILATAYSSPEQKGTGRHEPVLMTVRYGVGRVFHTVLGHADYSMNCAGFITTLQRGTEWAATGVVTLPVPDDFPTADKSSSRKVAEQPAP